LPSEEEKTIKDKEIKRYENCRFHSFDTYKSVYFNMWCVYLANNAGEWRSATCTCPSFLKNYICKHIIGISIRLKYCKAPPEAENIAIGTKKREADHLKPKSFDHTISFCY